jgi:hypothetical protein
MDFVFGAISNGKRINFPKVANNCSRKAADILVDRDNSGR